MPVEARAVRRRDRTRKLQGTRIRRSDARLTARPDYCTVAAASSDPQSLVRRVEWSEKAPDQFRPRLTTPMSIRLLTFLGVALSGTCLACSRSADSPTNVERPTVASLSVADGYNQRASSRRSALPVALTVRCLTKDGGAATGVTLVWEAAAVGSEITPSSTTCGSDGLARATYRLGKGTGLQVVTARAGSLVATFNSFYDPTSVVLAGKDTVPVEIAEAAPFDFKLLDADGDEMNRLGVNVSRSVLDQTLGSFIDSSHISLARFGSTWFRVRLSAFPLLADSVLLATKLSVSGTATRMLPGSGRSFAYVRSPRRIDSAEVQANGSFSLRSDAHAADPSVEVFLSTASTTASDYLPSYSTGKPRDFLSPISVLLLPRVWTIPRGRYAGKVLPISIEDMCNSDQGKIAECMGGGGTAEFDSVTLFRPTETLGTLLPAGWASAAFPIPVVFDRSRDTGPPISAADSAALWRLLDAMSAKFGTQLFRPANYSDFRTFGRPSIPKEGAAGAINVSFYDLTADGIGGTGGARTYTCNATIQSTCTYFAGSVTFSYPWQSLYTKVVEHEMMHALGAGHICKRPSVMDNCSPRPFAPTIELTDADIGEFDFWMRMLDTLRSMPKSWSAGEARNGERVLLRGKAAIP